MTITHSTHFSGVSTTTPVKTKEVEVKNSDTLSSQEIMSQIFDLLKQIGLDIGMIAKGSNQIQIDQAQISTNIEQITLKKNQETITEMQKQIDDQKSSFLGKFFHWLGFAVTALVCIASTPLDGPAGFIALGVAVATMTAVGTGQFDQNGFIGKNILQPMSEAFKKMGLGQHVADFLSDVVVMAVLTGGTGFAEGFSNGAEEAAAESSETALAEGASNATSRIATANVFTQTLFGTNASSNALLSMGCSKNAATIGAMIANMIAALATFKFATAAQGASSEGSSLSSSLISKMQKGLNYVQPACNIGSDVVQIDISKKQLDSAECTEALAEIQCETSKLTSDLKLWNSVESTSKSNEKSIMDSFQNTFNTDYSAYLHEIAG